MYFAYGQRLQLCKGTTKLMISNEEMEDVMVIVKVS